MARRRRSSGPEISLFPFLSILACLIGALTILIVALSVSEILQGRKDESVARAEDYVALEKEIAAREAEIARLQEELRRTHAAAVELAELRPRLDKLRGEIERLHRAAGQLESLRERLDTLSEEHDDLEDEGKKVADAVVEGDKQLGELAKQVGKGAPLRILPTSRFLGRTNAVFVEARAEGVVVHSPSKVVQVPAGQIRSHADFKKTVEYVAGRPNHVIVFLVRQDGRGSFYAARDFARENGVVTSKLPLVGKGDIDLSEFFRK